MTQITRLQPDCPPDAHKVIREPENKLNALIAVRLEDEEIEKYGAADTAEVMALMSATPNIICSSKCADALRAQAEAAEIKPNFIRVSQNDACILYPDGAQSEQIKFYDLAGNYLNFKGFLSLLSEKCIISVDTLSMLILRSISTVYPWDKLLAGDFVRQYLKACENLNAKARELLTDIRYGRVSSDIKQKEPSAYQFLRLERKLFLQYPSDD